MSAMAAPAHALSTRPQRAVSSRRRAVAATAAYWAIEALRVAVKWLPERWLETAAGALGDLVFYGIRWRRRVSLERIALVWPELTLQQQYRLARESYRHLALALLWFLRLPEVVGRSGGVEELVEIDAQTQARLQILLQDDRPGKRQRSAIVTTGHVGFWELLPPLLASSVLPTHLQWVVYRPLHNAPVNALCEELRTGEKRHLIKDKNCFHVLSDALSSTEVTPSLVGLVSDHRSSNPATSCSVQFLGQATSFPTGAARLHLTTQAPLWFAAVVSNPGQRYSRPAQRKPFKLLLYPIQAATEDVQSVTAAYAAALEDTVREYPSQYLWLHDLWAKRAAKLVSE